MKVCQIMAGKGDGGLEKHTIELSNLLQKKGIDVTMIAHPKYQVQLENVKFIPLDLTKGRNNFFILFQLYKILKKENFDVIHTQANKATSMLTKLKPFIKLTTVATLHNMKSTLKPFSEANHVISVSKKVNENLELNHKTVIYNGIEVFEREKYQTDIYTKYNIPKDQFIICSVARFTKVKRLDILIRAVREVENIHLILAGTGKEESNLIELSKKLNIYDKITFTGFVDQTAVREIMCASSLFVLTSEHEGFGYTFIEALFSNLPMISTDVADIKETIGKEFIIPFNDPSAVAKKIEKLKNNYPDTVDSFNDKFIYAREKFSVENMINQTIKIYDQVLEHTID